jgi:hypothetical protein
LAHKVVLSPSLLEPGWPGELTDQELMFITRNLHMNPRLASYWGFRPSMKRYASSAVQRVALYGDAADRPGNRALARPRKGRRVEN